MQPTIVWPNRNRGCCICLNLNSARKPKDIQQIPAALADLFAEVANDLQKHGRFSRRKITKSTSPLLQVQLFERGQDWVEKLNCLQKKLNELREKLRGRIKIARREMDCCGRNFAPGNFAEAGRTLPVVRLFQPLEQPDSRARRAAFNLMAVDAPAGTLGD